jgi:hypothetical protein
MTADETPLGWRISNYFYFDKSIRCMPHIVLRNAFFYLAMPAMVPRSTSFATQKRIAHREIWRRGEKKPMREASVSLHAAGTV